MDTKQLGKWGEELAKRHLTKLGYAIVDTNWHMSPYEIDLVAMYHGRLVMVEVKTRTDIDSNPLEAITRRKMLNMAKSANAFVQMNNLPHEIQFDVICVRGTPERYELDHFPDAFVPPLKSY